MHRPLISLALAAILAACTFVAPSSAPEAETQETVTLTAEGDGETVSAEEMTEPLQWAASVVDVDFLENQAPGAGVKLFGTAGGDPAMNGLYTHIAFYQSPGDGWRVFRLGDFLDYRVLSDAPGRVDLEIQESTMDQASGNIGSRTYYVVVTWTQGPEGAAPENVTVTPARAAQ